MFTMITSFLGGIPSTVWKILGALVVVLGILFYTYKQGEDKAQEIVAQYEQKLQAKDATILDLQSKINDGVITKYVDRIVTVNKQEEKTDEAIKNITDKFVLSNGWVLVHDSSATGKDADPTRAADASSSGITASEALDLITDNYTACRKNNEQLILLQQWINETAKNIADANNK